MKLKKIFLITVAVLSIFYTTGCWDMIDIDRRFFVGKIGVDRAEDGEQMLVSFSFAIVRKIAGGQGGSQGGGGGSPIVSVSTVADSIHAAARQVAMRLSRRLFFEHTRVILIGEELARDGIEEIVNFLERNSEINRRSRVIVVRGKAKDVMNFKNEIEVLPALYISNIFENQDICGRFVQVDVDEFMKEVHSMHGNALLPRLTPGKTDVKIGGAAVIKKYKLVGWLEENETLGANFVLEEIRGADIMIDIQGYKYPVVFTVIHNKTAKELLEAGDYPKFRVKLEVKGEIAETPDQIELDPEKLKIIEKMLEERINQLVLASIKKLQQEYQVDLLGFGEYLSKYKPEVWEEYEKDWENIFPEAEINVETKVKIGGIGASK
ncbi:Ger(x)C family spore germination protein [Thermosediminibacter oceani]|uniref:Germination protein, Ger(X)C family n=1 Tax=Thermosediminibacter oceani (strain ATCC BAA-1034 / DSM 16646 / JW/IW-1228P) TaxID=555079 RepID=D9S135_THEOJ|nr:Ger(x)C family spore germination protein [Thermosediminibacter oceani]ADL08914.1 germination protein, Ger(x)C family [Thermosediminibacter oceani DSM 16646]